MQRDADARSRAAMAVRRRMTISFRVLATSSGAIVMIDGPAV
jgi:hypothetical protein